MYELVLGPVSRPTWQEEPGAADEPDQEGAELPGPGRVRLAHDYNGAQQHGEERNLWAHRGRPAGAGAARAVGGGGGMDCGDDHRRASHDGMLGFAHGLHGLSAFACRRSEGGRRVSAAGAAEFLGRSQLTGASARRGAGVVSPRVVSATAEIAAEEQCDADVITTGAGYIIDGDWPSNSAVVRYCEEPSVGCGGQPKFVGPAEIPMATVRALLRVVGAGLRLPKEIAIGHDTIGNRCGGVFLDAVLLRVHWRMHAEATEIRKPKW
uniref:Uncharacterized protein n=1 Tax=Oryza meridionalis TaxID=40149 RepID=A0A0E0CMY6_9ORYZ